MVIIIFNHYYTEDGEFVQHYRRTGNRQYFVHVLARQSLSYSKNKNRPSTSFCRRRARPILKLIITIYLPY